MFRDSVTPRIRDPAVRGRNRRQCPTLTASRPALHCDRPLTRRCPREGTALLPATSHTQLGRHPAHGLLRRDSGVNEHMKERHVSTGLGECV